MNKRLFLIVNVDWFFLSHRLPLALKAKEEGWNVTIVTKNTDKKNEIEDYGLSFINFEFNRSSTNPLNLFISSYKLFKLYKSLKPDIVHHVTLKVCIVGGIAAKFAKLKGIVNAVTGLGYGFSTGNSIVKYTLKNLFKFASKGKNVHNIFQNNDDKDEITGYHELKNFNYSIIKGVGVNLKEYNFFPENDGIIKIILPARLLYDKGVIEFIKAAILLKKEAYGKAKFYLVGSLDPENKAGIKENEIQSLLIDNYIIWEGHSTNMISTIKSASIVVLPSYREGLPKVLIEAAAIGRPIITTNAPGCKECVNDHVNGFIVPVKDSNILASKMKQLIFDKGLRVKMGKESRKIAEKEFCEQKVIQQTINIYKSLQNNQYSSPF
jgi:glycosyltransferase involved in cell wall biosynthesis